MRKFAMFSRSTFRREKLVDILLQYSRLPYVTILRHFSLSVADLVSVRFRDIFASARLAGYGLRAMVLPSLYNDDTV